MSIQLQYPAGCALVAGGSGNVGAGVTRRLAEAGLPVTFTYLSNQERAEDFASALRDEGLQAWACPMDMRNAASIDRAIAFAQAQGGRLHTLACTAGAELIIDKLADISISDAENFFDADGMAYFRLINRAVPVMRVAGGGSITLCTTIALNRVIGFDGLSPFSKGAVDALVRQIAWEEAEHGIRCNAVPISVVTPLPPEQLDAFIATLPSPMSERFSALLAQINGAMRLPGPAKPEEAGDLFAFLASNQARFITGQRVAIDGGATL